MSGVKHNHGGMDNVGHRTLNPSTNTNTRDAVSNESLMHGHTLLASLDLHVLGTRMKDTRLDAAGVRVVRALVVALKNNVNQLKPATPLHSHSGLHSHPALGVTTKAALPGLPPTERERERQTLDCKA
eukprot:GFYU01021747.1.p1 GENE.GFYU01021747.1~~GFYU01021747.1.p1  ORF type:complete len:128 (-),score=17.81 GFYU01021747.1:402-785(-)